MADREHLEILKKGRKAWNDWRGRDKHGVPLPREMRYRVVTLSGRPDVRPADLRRADLTNMNLTGFQLEHCYLEGAILKGADLRASRLDWAQLHETDLRGANLAATSLNGVYASFAKFDGARLDNAILSNSIMHIASFEDCSLRGAKLGDCDLRDANMQRADLTGSDLGLAKFIGTRLKGANISGATLARTLFSGVDLSEVSGLDAVRHSGPSTIGVDTLYASGGRIPEIFLRGAGLEEALISYLPSLLAPNAIDFYSCFISYSHEQKSFARRLHDQLQMRGIRCWLDEHEILPGDDMYDMIDRGIRLWDKILLCCSKESLTSWWVNDEIDKALEKERLLQQERGQKVLAIIPLNLDNFMFEGWQDGRAATLRKRLAAGFVGWDVDNSKFESAFERVVQALRSDDNARQSPPLSKL